MSEDKNSLNNLTFGRYKPLKVLGEGAMGRVYLAEDPFLQRKLAIKVIVLDKNIDDITRKEYNQRFIFEAQSSAKLNHPSIVTIHDVGNDNQQPWIVFEYVEGEGLNNILNREKKVSLEKAITITLHIASALSVAHHHQIIHRDIKPANILIDSMTQIAKLADFGIAKAPWTELTQEGKTIGSPGYMSPEQIRGEELDERSDIFSLGVVLYQMITGVHPFLRDTMTNTLYATIEGTTKPIKDYVSNVPDSVCDIVDACIAPEKEKRISSANDLVKKLKALHLASKTAHFTFSEFKRKPANIKISPKNIYEPLKGMPKKIKKGSGFLIAAFNKFDFSYLNTLKEKSLSSFPALNRVIKSIKDYKKIITISATVIAASIFLIFISMTLFLNDPKIALPVESADNIRGIENVKLSETEEQLIKEVKRLISKDDLDEAEVIAKTLSQTKNISAYGHMLLGLIYLKDEDYDDAFDSFEQCLKEKKGSSTIKQNLNSLLYAIEKELQKEKAEDELLDIIVKTFNAGKNPVIDKWINHKHYWTRWNAVTIKKMVNKSVDSVNVYILDLQYAGSVRTRVRAAKILGKAKDKRAISPLKNVAKRGMSDPILSVTAERVLEENFNVVID